FYRIATWTVELPPLRERLADIPNLAGFFLARETARRGIRTSGISRAALDVLLRAEWPGNIRQLENEIARAALFLSDGQLLASSRLGPQLVSGVARQPKTLAERLEVHERKEIARTLELRGGDVVEAARELGLGRSTLYRRIKELGLDAPPESD